MSALESLLGALDPEQQRALLARLDAAAAPVGAAGTAAVEDGPRRLGRSEAPLSHAQHRLWFLHQLEPDNPAYNVVFQVDWPGPLDRAVLAGAFGELVERHEVLRTRYPARDGEPRQVIDPQATVPISEVDLTGLPAARRGAEQERLGRAVAGRRFDLANGPVAHLTVLRLDEQHSALLLAMHHIVCDRWSVELLLSELAIRYEARLRGADADLPAPTIQYADFATWQRDWLVAGALDRQLAYWRGRLGTPIPPLELPTDRPAAGGGLARGGMLRITVPDQLRDRLARLGREHDATLFTTLLAGFMTLLCRQTAQTDIAVNSVITSRSRPELETVPGMFLNTLPLRADLSGAPTFADALARVRASVTGAFEHQDVPFDRLVDEFASDRGSGSPFTPVMFAFSNLRELPGGLRATEIDTGGARATLLLVAEDGPRGLEFGWEYDRDRYDPDTIERLHGHLTTLLAAAATAADRPITELPLLSAGELRQLAGWNDTDVPYPLDRTIADLIDEAASGWPDAIALVFEGAEVSYGDLVTRSNRLAHHLVALGVEPGMKVAVHLHRSLELIVALLGVLKAGAAYVPLDPSYPAGRLAHIVADAAPPVLISIGELATALLAGAGVDGPTLIDLEAVDLDRLPATNPSIPLTADAPAYIIYTSGSTGAPKGVVNTHQGLTNHTLWMRDEFEVSTADVMLHKASMGFDVSLWESLVPLVAGARLILAAPDGHKDPDYLVRLIDEQRITLVHFVPAMFLTFLDLADLSRCRSLRHVLCSGEALPSELVRRFFATGLDARLENLYGPTEAAIQITTHRCHPDEPVGIVSIGRIISNNRGYILDGHDQPVPIGVPGELCLSGVQIALGYHGRPDLTAAAFVRDPFDPGGLMYRTGDLARWRRDGSIDYLGRRDHQVKLRGVRIELGEIEAALMTQEAVSDAVVLLREDTPGDPRLVAYLTLDAHAPAAGVPADQLRAALSRTLPATMVPAAFVTLSRIPLSPNGKIDRAALRAIAPEDIGTAEGAPPRDEVESALVQLYQEILSRSPIGIRDNFFHLGGHSLLATRLSARVRRDFGIELPLRTFFDAPTVETLAVALTEQAMIGVDPAGLDELLGDGTGA